MESNRNVPENAVGWQTTDALEHHNSTTTAGLANERQQPVTNKRVKSSTTAAVDVVHRVAASPRQMKTQIARISYTPARPSKAVKIENQLIRKPLTTFGKKIHTESSVTSPPTPTQTADSKIHTKEEYARRKYERHQEIQEIQTMLKEIAKSPLKSESKPSEKGKVAINKAKAEADAVRGPTFRRSKTEWLGSRPKAASTRREYARASTTERPRSRSSQPAATKSHELLPEGIGSKKKSYNAEEARQFMEEQRRRRRSNPTEIPQIHSRPEKTAFEKEQIKKRLEELRKNSRKIVSKNVSKKFAAQTVGNFRKDDGANGDEPWQADGKDSSEKTNPNMGLTISVLYKANYDTASGDNKLSNNGAVRIQISERADNSEKEQLPSVVNSPLKNIHVSQSDTQIPALKAQIGNSNKNDRHNEPLIKNQKRVGLLRKPETKDHSFSAIKEFSFDKENVALEMLTPKLTTPITMKATVHEQPSNEIAQTTRSISNKKDQQAQTGFDDATTASKTKVGAPTVPSNMHTSEEKRTQGIPCERSAEKQATKDEVAGTVEQHDLPYWLKPSAVQIYPYNFIMAVRRKLESIAEPEELKSGITHDKTTSTGDFNLKKQKVDTPRTSTSKKGVPKTQKYVRRRIVAECHSTSSPESFVTHTIERNNVHVNKEVENASAAVKQTLNRSQTLSDLNSNFSSISIQVPTSNSISELSIRSENVQIRTPEQESCLESRNTVQTDDDTTISSSVFNSPKRKSNQTEIDLSHRPISPLSLERVENLKITSSSKLKKAIDDKHVNVNRGNLLNNALKKTCPTKLDTNVDFSHLLDDFNRSLSQVIQVNEQLRITLDKSHHKLSYVNKSARQDESTSKQSHEYTTDFEESSDRDKCKNVVKQQPTGNMKQKKSLFGVTNVVKPLLASPKSADSDTSAAQLEKESSSHLDLNVSSVTNFSRNSSESFKQEVRQSCNVQEQEVEVAEPLQQEFEKKLEIIDEIKTTLRQSIQNSQTNRQVVEDEEEAENKQIKSSENERDEGKFTQCVKELKNHSKHISELNSTNNESCKKGSTTDSDRNEQLKLESNEISARYETESIVSTEILSFQQTNTKSVSTSNKLNDQMLGCDLSNLTKTCLTGSKNTSVNKCSNEFSSNNIVEDIRHDFSEINKIGCLKGVPECPPSTKRNSDSDAAHEVGERAFSFFQGKEKRSSAMSCSENNSSSSISTSSPGYNGAVVLNTGATPPSHKRKPPSTVKVSSTQAIDHKIVSLFQHSNLDFSALSSHNDSLSESSCSYTNIGLYEKLILNEKTKSEHLTALLKLREKALLDRTKGQIAWLEIQKEHCKTKGLHAQITAIKKKQRGILIKMEKEREDIKRLLQSSASTISKQASTTRLVQETIILPVDERRGHTKRKVNRTEYSSDTQATRVSPALVSFLPSTHLSRSARIAPQHKSGVAKVHSAPIVRATYELESSRSLEELLSKREADLRRRRQHVERLMQWHRRLDQEETEVLQMEQALLSCHNAHEKSPKRTTISPDIEQLTQKEYSDSPNAISSTSSLEKCQNAHSKLERRLKEIDKSLQELSTISSSNSPTVSVGGGGSERIEFVRTTGSKLNKLWRRLTSQKTEKFVANRHYKLCKRDLEQIYEEAKISVLQDFSQNEEHIAAELLERSASTFSNSQTCMGNAAASGVAVPRLDLNFSSEQSDPEPEECSVAEASSNSLLLDNYSPSVAEENFRGQVASETSVATNALDSNSSLSLNSAAVARQQQIEQNMQTFLVRTETTQMGDGKLRRSLSDTQLTKLYLVKEGFARAALSQHNVAVARSPQNSIETIINNRRTELADSSKGASTQADDTSRCSRSQRTSSKSCDTILENSIVSEDISNTKEIFPAQEVVTNISSGSSLSQTPVDCENKTNDIFANCEQTPISGVELSPSKSISINSYQSTNSLEIKDFPTDIDTSSCIGEQNFNSIFSYSCDFENISTHLQATSGCTGCTPEESSLTTSLAAQDYSNDRMNENAHRANNNQTPSFEALSFKEDANNGNEQDSSLNQSANENNLLETYEIDFESEADETCIDDLSLPHFESEMNTTHEDGESPDKNASAPAHPMAPVSEQADTLVEDSKESATQLMPDIINELEIRRCRQIVQENEQLKQYEHVTAVPYMYVREIPNKPPPPYVPPAHGSPMTTIFPSEERIKDITYRRSHELYCELLKTDYTNERGEKLASVMEEKITNIYERIILDICREYLVEHHEVLTQGDPSNFHSQLAFFNPPDRLRCIQESIYKEVRRCLAMDKTPPKRAQVYSVYGQRAKRDHIGKIIIQEMYDEDDKWCSFHSEETEVLNLIIEEIIGSFLSELAREALLAEGGSIEEEEEQDTNETGNEEPFGDTATTPIDINVPSDLFQVATQGQDGQSSAGKNQMNES